MFDCPICRSKNAVYNAGIQNVDKALLNFLKLYFPKDIKAKQREIQQDISEEETRAIVMAQERNRILAMLRLAVQCATKRYTRTTASIGLLRSPTRALSSSTACEGLRRRFEGRRRYPQPQSEKPDRPKESASMELMDQTNNIAAEEKDMLESISITDKEVNMIYDSIMSANQRQMRDEQSLRHRSHAEYLEMRKKEREARRAPVIDNDGTQDGSSPKQAQPKQKSDSQKIESKQEVLDSVKTRSISEKTMEQLVYVDTRVVREMEEAKRAVVASVDTAHISSLEDKVRAAAAAKAEIAGETTDSNDMHSTEVESRVDREENLSDELVPELSLREFNHVIFANALVGQVHDAMRAYDLLLEAGLKPDQTTFANLTVAHAKGGDLETAVSMFTKLKSEGLEPTIYSYGTLIRAYMEFNRVDDAFRVYEMMKARQIWPNIPVYNSLIVSCLRIGDTHRAWGVFEHMRYTIAQPDEISFSIMIHACAKNGEVEKAMNLFEEMVSNNLALSDVTFNSLIHACAVRPDYFDECFRLLGLMEGHGFQPDFYTYNTVIYACARKRKLGLAREIFRDMLKRSLNPEQEDLIKIGQITISNMMWAYAGYLPAVKNCSWRVVKRYEGIALKALADVKRVDEKLSTNSLGEAYANIDEKLSTQHANSENLLETQSHAAQVKQQLQELRDKGAPKEVIDQHLVKLVNALIPELVPVANNQVASEAVRLMRFYLEDLKGEVNTWLLNAYLAALIKNGRFESAWRVVLGDFKKFGLAKDGWTYLRMIEMCARTRDVPSAWRVWDEYKSWRKDVETELKTPGYETLKDTRTKVYKFDSKADGPQIEESLGDAAALNRTKQDMLALSEALVFPGESMLPTSVAGGALAVTAADREIARRQIGCDMKTEHATYIEMVTLLSSSGDFRAAIHLLREEKRGILEHKHNPTMTDVNVLYRNATAAGNKHAALDIRGLCMQKPLNQPRRELHRKWGTSFNWELTGPQYKALSRRFPEEFRPHKEPFKDGEYVYSRLRDNNNKGNNSKEISTSDQNVA
ncbi:hypothetical protein H4R20_004921 [Coemansia guatemalensis]|uniref:PROP1-like PPR domain-containing protein n=1 Tax=Coemansia guatemalensis TaxID=2761395 RepID=A0A9W8LQ25_9FUNG|nr:hypothetical protein H4R20_004921 [Coemansia guatemalensis]